MNAKNKILLAVIITEVLVLASAGAFLLYLNSDNTRITRQLKKAEQYLETDDSDNAAKAFQNVLDLDSRNVEAYLGLAKLYEDTGEPEKAVAILEQGINETDSKKLIRRLAQYSEESSEATEPADTVLAESDDASSGTNESTEPLTAANETSKKMMLRQTYTPTEIDEALRAYQYYVYDYQSFVKCGLFYLNDDNMPECALYDEDLCIDQVLFYLDGEVFSLNSGFGTIHNYNPMQNLLVEHYGLHQTGGDAFYRLSDDGKSLETIGGAYYEWSEDNHMINVEIDGVPSDEQGYNDYIASFGTFSEDAYNCARFTTILDAYRSLTEQTIACTTYDFYVSRFEKIGNTLYIDTVDDSNKPDLSFSYPTASDFRCLHRYTDGSAEEISYREMKKYLDDSYKIYADIDDEYRAIMYDSSPGSFEIIIQDGKVIEICTIWS